MADDFAWPAPDGIATAAEFAREPDQVPPAEQDRPRVVDGAAVAGQVEFGRVDGDAAGPQAVQRPLDEPQPGLDRPQVLERAT